MPDRPAAILGAGNWGTALAVLLARKGVPVRLWGRDDDLIAEMARTRVNARYLPGVSLDARIAVTGDLDGALRDAEVVILAVPCAGMRDLCAAVGGRLADDQLLVSAAKGLEEATGRRMSEVIFDAVSGPADRVAVLSGPNLGAEVAAGVATTAVVAGGSDAARHRIQDVLTDRTFRVYTNPDVAGVELGGALKNVIAIAVGAADGLGFGANARAALMTRGLAEMTRLGVARGARAETFRGLSGLGDLIATCAGPMSRNYRVGHGLGRGERLAAVLAALGQVAEGVPTARVAARLAAEAGVELPITTEVVALLDGAKSPVDAVAALMSRPARAETD